VNVAALSLRKIAVSPSEPCKADAHLLGQIDELFGAPATTRSWNTILAVLRILKAQERPK
jgi:hypothetical protein